MKDNMEVCYGCKLKLSLSEFNFYPVVCDLCVHQHARSNNIPESLSIEYFVQEGRINEIKKKREVNGIEIRPVDSSLRCWDTKCCPEDENKE